MLTSRSLVGCAALAGVAAAVFVGKDGLGTVVGCGIADDAVPSVTAKDWVSSAEHVVVATPVREQDVNRREFKKGPVRYATDRTVTFRTDRVLWSAPGRRHAVDKGFDMVAAGWDVYRESGRRVKRTTPEAPRLEPGHTYLLAVRWEGGEGPDAGAGRWTVLGEGAAVPFDDRTVGRGEWCGRVLGEEDVALAERFSRSDDHSLEKVVLGRDEQAVTGELERARKE
ncbi:hypothetical protein ABZ330_17740 [Streptomyces sp. NPDC006172]|uniref:hypothetical protein n=1 Tax=Streptomyces sp. NPDC006172 TaxID=3154470 RepID=UPI0033F9947E